MLLTQLKADVKELKEQLKLTNVMVKDLTVARGDEEDDVEIPEGVHLPASTPDELDFLEDEIKADKSFEKYLVSTLYLNILK